MEDKLRRSYEGRKYTTGKNQQNHRPTAAYKRNHNGQPQKNNSGEYAKRTGEWDVNLRRWAKLEKPAQTAPTAQAPTAITQQNTPEIRSYRQHAGRYIRRPCAG